MTVRIESDFNKTKKISDRFYGIFFEDINFSIDGGMNNNQIANPSFEEIYYDYVKDFHYYYFKIFHAKRKLMTMRVYDDFHKHWFTGGEGYCAVRNADPIAEQNPHYLYMNVNGRFSLTNTGYNGGNGFDKRPSPYYRRHLMDPAVGVKEGHAYDVSLFVRIPEENGFDGKAEFYVEREDGKRLTQTAEIDLDVKRGEWVKVHTSLKGVETGVGFFRVAFTGKGELNADSFYFGDADYWKAGDPRWSEGRMRKDLVETLRELNPKFMRFPGGCLVEGLNLDTSYDWTITVGPVEARGHKYNLWGSSQKDLGYMQSNEIGFYEYFLLAEDLGAEPMPILNAGLACQGRTRQSVTKGDKEFERRLNNILALIEYANGDPSTSEWAKRRAMSGHPAPFNLKMIGIGNENFGEVYNKNFDIMAKAVKERYPDIEIIWSSGFNCFGHKHYEENRVLFDGKHPDVIVDDHFYRVPEWLIENAGMYDNYPRTRNRIFLGEYAGNGNWSKKALVNNYYSALSEATYLTGLERNADIVVMSSYAPLFSRVGGEQWKHNMINFNSLEVMRTANYMVQREYASNYGTKYLLIPNAVEDGVYTSITADDDYIYVKSTNVQREARDVEYAFKNVSLGKAEYAVMASDDDTARNKLSYYGKPEEPLFFVRSELDAKDGVSLTLPARSVNVLRIKIGK